MLPVIKHGFLDMCRPWFSQPKKTPWPVWVFPSHVDDYQRASVTKFFTSLNFQSFSDFSDLMFSSQVKGTFLLTVTKVQASISLWTININHVQESRKKKNMKKLDLPLPLWNTLDMFLKPNRQVPKLHFRQVTVQWVSLRWPLRRRLFWSLWGSHWPNRWCIACWTCWTTGENRKGPRWLKTGVDTLCNNWSCFHADEVHGKILILKIQISDIEHFL